VKEYNARTAGQIGQVIPVKSRSSATTRSPSSPRRRRRRLIKKAAGLPRGSAEPNKNKVGKITKSQVREIAEIKLKDLEGVSLESAMRMVEGTARSMGVTIVD
jgi:large subunit ribosomal protein L11